MVDSHLIRIATHDGAFHSDEVLAVAILTKLFPRHQVLRSRKQEILDSADFVVDVGGVYDHTTHRYDHHMKDPPGDGQGHIYSSAGLIWFHFARSYLQKIGIPRDYTYRDRPIDLQQEVEKIINARWVYPIDRCDNGVTTGITPISEIVSAISPIDPEKSKETFDKKFLEAVSIVSHLLERACFHAADYAISKLHFARGEKEKLNDGKILLVDTEVKQFGNFSGTDVHFVIYPGIDYSEDRTYYIIRPIYRTESKQYKTSFPEDLFGMGRQEISDKGYPGVFFIHHTGYIAKVDDKETAIRFCQALLEDLDHPD